MLPFACSLSMPWGRRLLMASQVHPADPYPSSGWRMYIVPESYDRSPLTEKEWWALELRAQAHGSRFAQQKETVAARQIMARLNQPLTDVFLLRHHHLSRL